MESLKQEITQLISQLLLRKKLPDLSQTENKLVTKGYLDSIDIMQLIVHLEKEYNVDFSKRGFNQNEFDSVDSIVQLIQDLQK